MKKLIIIPILLISLFVLPVPKPFYIGKYTKTDKLVVNDTIICDSIKVNGTWISPYSFGLKLNISVFEDSCQVYRDSINHLIDSISILRDSINNQISKSDTSGWQVETKTHAASVYKKLNDTTAGTGYYRNWKAVNELAAKQNIITNLSDTSKYMEYGDTTGTSQKIASGQDLRDSCKNLQDNINLKLNETDTVSLSNRINTKLSKEDSIGTGAKYVTRTALMDSINNNSGNTTLTVSATNETGSLTHVNTIINIFAASNKSGTTFEWSGPGEFLISDSATIVTLPGLYTVVAVNGSQTATNYLYITQLNFSDDYGNISADTGIFNYIKLKLGSNVASNTTITPTGSTFHVTGITTIDSIVAPTNITSVQSLQITIIPDGLFSTSATKNIALATIAVVSKAILFTYDGNLKKWYPSY